MRIGRPTCQEYVRDLPMPETPPCGEYAVEQRLAKERMHKAYAPAIGAFFENARRHGALHEMQECVLVRFAHRLPHVQRHFMSR